MSLISEITQGIKTFSRGGIHPPEYKELTAGKPIEDLAPPENLFVPLSQHIGAPCRPLVKKGDPVKAGQVIAQSDAFVSAPIHAPVSGSVLKIASHPHPLGHRGEAIFLFNDAKDEWDPSIDLNAPTPTLDASKGKEYLQAIREAGLVGLGGAAFPTHVKLSPPPDKKINTLLINGAECEPYLTADYRLMLEKPDAIVTGLRIHMIILGVRQAIIAIEDNKPAAIASMRDAIAREDKTRAAFGEIGVVACETKYPQGGERQLINAVLRRSVPSGGLPMEVGVVVSNIGTCFSAAEAVVCRKPLVERVVTVAGTGIRNPKNLRVRVGTPFRTLLEACGYRTPEPGSKLIMGGPMMGKAQRDLDVPVIKGASGLILLTPEEVRRFEQRPCLRCGRCVEVCPMGLMPSRLANFAESNAIDSLEKLGIMDCVECGACAYICPSQRHLVQWVRMGKMKLQEKKNRK